MLMHLNLPVNHYLENQLLYNLVVILKLTEAKWRIHASLNHANIVSDHGLSPHRRQAII